jgi:homoserine kinase
MAHVSVPASTSNLGAGFDCVGLAVDRRLDVEVTVTSYDKPYGGSEITIARHGTLAGLDVRPDKDLLAVGFNAAAEAANRPFTGRAHFTVHSSIPVARGLGSSAAAIVAGAVLANDTLELGLSPESLVDLCAHIEGHPDNVAAAYYGGAILGVLRPGAAYKVSPLAVHESLSFVFAVPSFVSETKRARGVLPPVIPFSSAVLAAGRSAALVQGLATGDADLLAIGLDDVLHVPHRRALIAGYDEVTGAAKQAGAYGATLSGSGSTLVAIAPHAVAGEVCACMRAAWSALGIGCESFVSSQRFVAGAATSAAHAALAS